MYSEQCMVVMLQQLRVLKYYIIHYIFYNPQSDHEDPSKLCCVVCILLLTSLVLAVCTVDRLNEVNTQVKMKGRFYEK